MSLNTDVFDGDLHLLSSFKYFLISSMLFDDDLESISRDFCIVIYEADRRIY